MRQVTFLFLAVLHLVYESAPSNYALKLTSAADRSGMFSLRPGRARSLTPVR
jgi:hypothetical protein